MPPAMIARKVRRIVRSGPAPAAVSLVPRPGSGLSHTCRHHRSLRSAAGSRPVHGGSARRPRDPTGAVRDLGRGRQMLEDRLKATRGTSDDPKNLAGCCLLLQGLRELTVANVELVEGFRLAFQGLPEAFLQIADPSVVGLGPLPGGGDSPGTVTFADLARRGISVSSSLDPSEGLPIRALDLLPLVKVGRSPVTWTRVGSARLLPKPPHRPGSNPSCRSRCALSK